MCKKTKKEKNKKQKRKDKQIWGQGIYVSICNCKEKQ